jgi:tetratricopeptide (TPR) repeat protein
MIIFRLIAKVFVRFASVALIAAMVQVSLISLPSAQTISAQTEREALGSSLSETVEQIEGTYDGTFTISQVTGEHQISLTFQQSGADVAVTYRSVLGGRGSGKSTIAGNVITAVPLRSEPNCPGSFTASFKFFGDTVSFTYSGQDCNGPAQGRGIAKKLKLVSPLTSEADELTSKAMAFAEAGKYAEAIPLAQQVLAIREKVLGPDHPDVATVLNGFGILYEEAGRFAEAEPLYKRSLAIREKALGPDHPDHFLVAQSLNNLAELYERQGRYTEAEPFNQRALAIFEKTLGPDNFEVAGSLNNLAAVYDQQGRYAEAEPLFKRSLAIREKALGPDNPNVNIAQSLNNLAALYVHQGRYTEAELLYKRSLVMYEQALGPNHPDVAKDRWIYRGQPKDWPLRTTIERALHNWEIDLAKATSIEFQTIREFRRRMREPQHHRVHNDTLFCLALMQHHGAPTRLLDCTYSPFAAAAFAMQDGPVCNTPVVWCFRGRWCEDAAKSVIATGRLWLLKHRNDDRRRTDETFNPLYQLEPYAPMGSDKGRFVKHENPIHLNERLTTQQGVFLCPGNLRASFIDNLKAMPDCDSVTNVVKLGLNLNREEAVELVRHLKNMNLGFAALFPGLDGFARSIGQQIFHYAELARDRTGLVHDTE